MSSPAVPSPPEQYRSLRITTTANWKRRPVGSPADDDDMDVEVLALSPQALLDPGHLFVCDVCGRRYHRVYSLHRHRRLLHGVTASSGKEETLPDPGRRKTRLAFVCPEPTCRRHDPDHAMDNIPRLKKHFRARHAHGHGGSASSSGQAARSSMEHQDTRRDASQPRSERSPSPGEGVTVAASQQLHLHPSVASSVSPSCGDDLGASATAAATGAAVHLDAFDLVVFTPLTPPERPVAHHNIVQELQLMPPRGSCAAPGAVWWPAPPRSHAVIPQLELSLWFGAGGGNSLASSAPAQSVSSAARLKHEAREQLRLAAAEKAAAELARAQARRQAELAGHELAIARRVRAQAQAEFTSAHAFRRDAARQVDAMLLQAACGCGSCRHKFGGAMAAPATATTAMMSSKVASYVPSVVVAEVDNDGGHLRADLAEVDNDGGHLRADRGRANPC